MSKNKYLKSFFKFFFSKNATNLKDLDVPFQEESKKHITIRVELKSRIEGRIFKDGMASRNKGIAKDV